jgi:retron-type reverse transcriptase
MRKSRKQQKNRNSGQIDLFDKLQEKPEESTTGVTGKEIPKAVELLSRLERERTLTPNIMERIIDYVNLNRANQQVVRNGGSSGIDGMDIEGFKQWYGKNVNELREAILTEQYEVSPVLKVEIPKPTGGTRVLGIPTIKDRLIQQAIHQELNKHYEPYFSENSYGFRPGRSAHQAIE